MLGKVARLIVDVMPVSALNADVSFSIANRLWAALSGLTIMVLVGIFTNPVVQGFYFTFSSLIFLQVFIEMGLGIALIQLIGHEMACLSYNDDDLIVGEEGAKKRLHSLVRFAGSWFSVGSVILLIMMITFGLFFFYQFGRNQLAFSEFNKAIVAWVLVAFGVSFSLVVNAALFVVEGSGRVASAARIRLVQGVISTLAAALTLICGGGLFALAFQTLLMPTVGAIALARRHRAMLLDLWYFRSDLEGLNWRSDIWPFQSRIAVSWLSGFFALQAFSPLLFAISGATDAGRMGMSLQLFTALNGLLIVLVTARTPMFTRFIALGQRDELRRWFGRAFRQSTLLLAIALLAFVPALLLGTWLLPRLPERIVPLPYLFPLGLTCLANHLLFCQAAFLRAHREEPFMVLSFASGVLTVMSAASLIPIFGLLGAVFAYSGVTLLFTLPIGTKIFLRYWNLNA